MGEQFFEHTLTLRPVIDDCAAILRMVEELQTKLETAQSQIVQLQATLEERDAAILAMGQRYSEAQTAIRLRDETIRHYQVRANDAIATLQGENDGDLDL